MNNKKPLILIGAGGHCKSVIDVAESEGYEIMGILDVPEKLGEKVFDYEIIGNDNDIPKFVDKAHFVVTVGSIKNPTIRIKIHQQIENAGGKFATIIASTAHVSKYAEIGAGSVIMHQAVVNAGAKVGKGCIINTFSNIEHDAQIGNFCHISTGAMINGDCNVGENSFIGSQSVLSNSTIFPANSVLAAGSFIRKSQRYEGIYSGNPAKLMKKSI